MLKENNVECDIYFLISDKALHAGAKSVCIRTMEPSGIKLWISKGPESEPMCEAATNITDAYEKLEHVGNYGIWSGTKSGEKRGVSTLLKFHITVDSLPGIHDVLPNSQWRLMMNLRYRPANWGWKFWLINLA